MRVRAPDRRAPAQSASSSRSPSRARRVAPSQQAVHPDRSLVLLLSQLGELGRVLPREQEVPRVFSTSEASRDPSSGPARRPAPRPRAAARGEALASDRARPLATGRWPACRSAGPRPLMSSSRPSARFRLRARARPAPGAAPLTKSANTTPAIAVATVASSPSASAVASAACPCSAAELGFARGDVKAHQAVMDANGERRALLRVLERGGTRIGGPLPE